MTNSKLLLSWLALSVTGLVACAGEEAAHQYVPGKGDGNFDIVEAGPIADGGSSYRLQGKVPAYRMVSFGDTEYTITHKMGSSEDAFLVVEGPLEGNGDNTPAGTGPIFAEDDNSGGGKDAKLTLKLSKPGVYRVLAGTRGALVEGVAPTGIAAVRLDCTANCTRPRLSQKEAVQEINRDPIFAELLKAELGKLLPPEAAAQYTAQLNTILADPNLTGLDRFPTIPFSLLGTLRPALGGLQAEAPKPKDVITGDLAAVLGPCNAPRVEPGPMHPALPRVGYGHFRNLTLTPCQSSHAGALAKVLTSLAANNGSKVTYSGKDITTPKQLFDALIATGHSIEARSESTYANFIAMSVDGKDVIWPVWIDTGLKLANGESYVIPMGHGHFAWRISGADINARVTFYMGQNGVGFFGQTDDRPAWTGLKVQTTASANTAKASDYDYILATVDTAHKYMRRILVEREGVAKNMRSDGYGYVGVCLDSAAVIEYATKKTVTSFPLMRAKELDAQPAMGDGLDSILRTLPKDGDGLPDARDALRRAVAMQPHDDASPHNFDAKLTAQTKLARSMLGR